MDVPKAASKFQELGIFVNYVPYPAVPENEQRFRVSLMANHTNEDIDALVAAVEEVWATCGRRSGD